MRWLPSYQALLLGLIGLGCGGGDDDDDSNANVPSGLAGMYQAMTTTTSSPCDAAGMPVINDPVYFQIKDEQAFGIAYIAVYPCLGTDPSSCEEFADIDFATSKGGGRFETEAWGISTDGTPMPTECSGFHTTDVVQATATGVTLVSTQQLGPLMGAELCKIGGDFTDQQEAAVEALPCASKTTVEGSALAP